MAEPLNGENEAICSSNDSMSSAPPIPHTQATRHMGDLTVISKMEAIFTAMADDLYHHRRLSVPIQRRPHRPRQQASQLRIETHPPVEWLHVTFPGATPQEAWKFSRN